jgi:FixJ family two-component response regulator/anti-sigma regulatory factor (Ser/Thr protein kinase)
VDRACILAVDDDPIFLRVIVATLESAGYKVVTASDLASAKAILAEGDIDRFACALIDHRLPDGDGTQVLEWLRPHETGVAAIIVTASGERELMQQSMIGGACNFLQKPVTPKEIRAAVATALSAMRGRRRAVEAHREAQGAARVYENLLKTFFSGDVRVEYRFLPQNELGGDFLNHQRLPDGSDVYIISDVSGHDLAAATASAFCHGWMLGLLTGCEVEAILEGLNRALISVEGAAGSLAVTVLKVDTAGKCMTAWNCGGLTPVFVDWWGAVRSMGARGSSPLGWFETTRPTRVSTGIPPGPVWMWTDGLESLADSIGASALSVAYALLAAPASELPAWLNWSNDDILTARIWPHSRANFTPPNCFHPLISEECSRRTAETIDSMQRRWKNSLGIALPEIPGDTMHDILLAAREALLNALRHGCYGCETAAFQLLYNPGERVLRVRVSDPGPGHDFGWQPVPSDDEPPGSRRGLMLIHALASCVSSRRQGAELVMDFILSPDLHIIRNQEAA